MRVGSSTYRWYTKSYKIMGIYKIPQEEAIEIEGNKTWTVFLRNFRILLLVVHIRQDKLGYDVVRNNPKSQ